MVINDASPIHIPPGLPSLHKLTAQSCPQQLLTVPPDELHWSPRLRSPSQHPHLPSQSSSSVPDKLCRSPWFKSPSPRFLAKYLLAEDADVEERVFVG